MTLPSVDQSQPAGLKFLKVVDEASRDLPSYKLTLRASEPLLFKSKLSRKKIRAESLESVNIRNTVSLAWSSNIAHKMQSYSYSKGIRNRKTSEQGETYPPLSPLPSRSRSRYKNRTTLERGASATTIAGGREIVVDYASRESSPVHVSSDVTFGSTISVNRFAFNIQNRVRRASVGFGSNNNYSELPKLNINNRISDSLSNLTDQPDYKLLNLKLKDENSNENAQSNKLIKIPRRAGSPLSPRIDHGPISPRQPSPNRLSTIISKSDYTTEGRQIPDILNRRGSPTHNTLLPSQWTRKGKLVTDNVCK